MTRTGVVRGRQAEFDGDVTLPEGTRVRVIPAEPAGSADPRTGLISREWLDEACNLRSRMPETSDSVELVQRIRAQRTAE